MTNSKSLVPEYKFLRQRLNNQFKFKLKPNKPFFMLTKTSHNTYRMPRILNNKSEKSSIESKLKLIPLKKHNNILLQKKKLGII